MSMWKVRNTKLMESTIQRSSSLVSILERTSYMCMIRLSRLHKFSNVNTGCTFYITREVLGIWMITTNSPVAEGGSVWHILGGYAIMFFWVEIYSSLRK